MGGQWSSDQNNCPTLLLYPVLFGAFFNGFSQAIFILNFFGKDN